MRSRPLDFLAERLIFLAAGRNWVGRGRLEKNHPRFLDRPAGASRRKSAILEEARANPPIILCRLNEASVSKNRTCIFFLFLRALLLEAPSIIERFGADEGPFKANAEFLIARIPTFRLRGQLFYTSVRSGPQKLVGKLLISPELF